MRTYRMVRVLLGIGLLGMGLIGGCGYGFRGTVNNLPPDIKAVHIPIFVNNTTETGAETIFANALIYEFTRGRTLEVVPDPTPRE